MNRKFAGAFVVMWLMLLFLLTYFRPLDHRTFIIVLMLASIACLLFTAGLKMTHEELERQKRKR